MTIKEFKAKSTADIMADFETILADLTEHDVDNAYWSKVQGWIDEFSMKHTIFTGLTRQSGPVTIKRSLKPQSLGFLYRKRLLIQPFPFFSVNLSSLSTTAKKNHLKKRTKRSRKLGRIRSLISTTGRLPGSCSLKHGLPNCFMYAKTPKGTKRLRS